MSKWVHDFLYNRPNSKLWRHSFIHTLVMFILTVLHLEYIGIWQSQIPYKIWTFFQRFVSEKTYCETAEALLFHNGIGLLFPLFMLLYILAVCVLLILKKTKIRILFFILLLLFFWFSLSIVLGHCMLLTPEAAERSRCESLLKEKYIALEKEGKVDPLATPVSLLYEDAPNSHKLNIRHSLWSDGTITVYKPWKNNQENNQE